MQKRFGLLCVVLFAVISLSAVSGGQVPQSDQKPVVVRDNAVIPAPPPPPVEIVQGFSLNGPKEVIQGNFLTLTVDGIESKLGPDGVRVPKVRVCIDPPSDNLISVDSGYRYYFTEALKPGQNRKEFVITVSANNPDPNEPPFLFARRFAVVRNDLEPDAPAPPGPGPKPPGPKPPVTVPPDAFGNVGQSVLKAKATDNAQEDVCIGIADLYEDVATKLENGTFITLAAAQKDLLARRVWPNSMPTVVTTVVNAWNSHYETMNKAEYIEFCRAVAAGLKG
jgi:hypothetical protein